MLTRIPERYLVPLYRVEDVRRREQASFAQEGESYAMMHRAGEALYRHILHHNASLKHLSVVVGGGNNGGDGLVVAALAAQDGIEVTVYDCSSKPRFGDAEYAEKLALKYDNIQITRNIEALNQDPGQVVVDGLLGIGFHPPISEDLANAIAAINQKRAQGAWIVSVDCPSGLDVETGRGEWLVEADLVVTFIADKLGHYLLDGAVACHQIVMESLQAVDLPDPPTAYFLPSAVLENHPPCLRLPNSHKGTYGHVTVLGGDLGFGGAAIMASGAAAKSGAGTVTLMTQSRHLSASLVRNPNVMCVSPEDIGLGDTFRSSESVLVIGPGLGRTEWSKRSWQAFLATEGPAVVDADGLYWLGEYGQPMERPAVLTPHPGEAARLLHSSIADILEDLVGAAQQIATRFQSVVILKGATSVVANQKGDVVILGQPCPALAKGGSGDVLSGMVGACLAYYHEPFEAAVIAAAWHNKAAKKASLVIGQISMQPYQLLDYLE